MVVTLSCEVLIRVVGVVRLVNIIDWCLCLMV